MVTWMLMLLHVDISYAKEDERSCTLFVNIDVLKFTIKITLFILTISKIQFLCFKNTIKEQQ